MYVGIGWILLQVTGLQQQQLLQRTNGAIQYSSLPTPFITLSLIAQRVAIANYCCIQKEVSAFDRNERAVAVCVGCASKHVVGNSRVSPLAEYLSGKNPGSFPLHIHYWVITLIPGQVLIKLGLHRFS